MAIDTATPSSSVAVFCGDRLEGEILLNNARHHTETLMVSVENLLKSLSFSIRDMDFFAAVVGPGSFTGLRVGLATVKGLALAAGRPTVGVSALRALAVQLSFCRLPVCAMLDARKKEVYAGLFDCKAGFPEPLHAEVVRPPEMIITGLDDDTVFVGSGAEVYCDRIRDVLGERARFVPAAMNCLRASHAGVLARHDFRQGKIVSPEQLAPHYIRPSEAEIMWAKKQGRN
jgi:tRNA threonylcarbamoyladenosine biosynthesis protein TsaB